MMSGLFETRSSSDITMYAFTPLPALSGFAIPIPIAFSREGVYASELCTLNTDLSETTNIARFDA